MIFQRCHLLPVANLPVVSYLSIQKQVEPPKNIGYDQTYVLSHQLIVMNTILSNVDSRLSFVVASENRGFKSISLQGQMEFPAMFSAAKTKLVP